MIIKRCSDILDKDKPICCNSCHEDEEEFNISMLDIIHYDILYVVCCKVQEFIKAKLGIKDEF